MGRLTTHVLDTATGKPAAGIRIQLFRASDDREPLVDVVSNSDGRVDQPLLQGEAFSNGEYELVFHAGDYFGAQQGAATASARFLDRVVIRFSVGDAGEHYHVPLLLAPFGYSTYRGS